MTDDPPPRAAHPLAQLGPLPDADRPLRLDHLQIGGIVALAVALVAAAGGWWGVSGTADPAEQLPYLASAGLAVGVFVAAGVTLLVASEHARDRAVLGRVLAGLGSLEDRLEASEASLAAVAVLVEELRDAGRSPTPGSSNGRAPRRRAPSRGSTA